MYLYTIFKKSNTHTGQYQILKHILHLNQLISLKRKKNNSCILIVQKNRKPTLSVLCGFDCANVRIQRF